MIAAAGGRPPYRWTSNGLPAGLTINSTTGLISGTPTAAGNFGVAITVSDSALANFSDRFTLTVNLPSATRVTISGLPGYRRGSATVHLAPGNRLAYPAPITGQAILSFSPDTGPADRTISFPPAAPPPLLIFPPAAPPPVLRSQSRLEPSPAPSPSLCGSQAGGIDITPSPAPTITPKWLERLRSSASVQVNRSGSTINIVVTGYSTAREVTQARFAFTAASGQTLAPSASSITIDANSLFGNWFLDPANSQFGSVFIFTQPFTIQGDATAVIPVSVTLTNRVGSTDGKIQ